MNLNVALTLDSWVKEILVDPISKKPFTSSEAEKFNTEIGIQYHFEAGVPDFRVGMRKVSKDWAEGQAEYEKFLDKYLDNGEADPNFYKQEQQVDAPMYERLPLLGRTIDVGGGLGAVRQYMTAGQEYISIDPAVGIHQRAANRPRFFDAYPMLVPLNLVWGFAEFLPFKDDSFDTVNMRSCIDHFANPEQALLEAYRILRQEGRLIVGISVENKNIKGKIKNTIKDLRGFLLPQFKDHHIWHPTYDGLVSLCDGCGFSLVDYIWQNEEVVYCSFMRKPQLSFQ
jgi:ubiquinone/menaquinone biosynthesis C-methylase UbiE